MIALDAINLATYEGAKAIGLGSLVGSIEVGKRADLIALRTDLPHVNPLYSVLSQLVYAYQGMEVDTVICEGRVLMNAGSHETLNATRILSEVRDLQVKLSQHLAESERN
jgi:5-methylthioadenosine/S-adenosylhomocysteine deaminase